MVYKDQFAIITGSMVLVANSQENANKGITTKSDIVIDYPSGFNSDNCVVISAERSGIGNYGYGWSDNIDGMDMYNGIEPLRSNIIFYYTERL